MIALDTKTVMIVEDDMDILETLAQVLESEGYHVITKTNGREALNYLQNAIPPSLILLDLMMPVMDGWQFRQEQLRSSKIASIPVVIVSADGHASQKAAVLGANDYLTKPVELETLLDTVARHCAKRPNSTI